mmetsp:Transcript_16320/g.35754  ORF Transcript_16320/g.35754 Transcript_16320/m.35754 type:complete len:205 (+) Transcript_16320:705-1319(+)
MEVSVHKVIHEEHLEVTVLPPRNDEVRGVALVVWKFVASPSFDEVRHQFTFLKALYEDRFGCMVHTGENGPRGLAMKVGREALQVLSLLRQIALAGHSGLKLRDGGGGIEASQRRHPVVDDRGSNPHNLEVEQQLLSHARMSHFHGHAIPIETPKRGEVDLCYGAARMGRLLKAHQRETAIHALCALAPLLGVHPIGQDDPIDS